MYNVFIVEDDKKIRDELEIFLRNNGYNVTTISDFNDVVEKVINSKIDLLLLDINLPQNDGYFICKQIRKKSDVPIIMVTSKNSDIDELMSINFGADDFITKPYNLQILLARMESLLKRANKDTKIKNILEYNGLEVDMSKSIMKYNDNVLELTKNELKCITYLIKNKGSIVSREDLMTYLWDSEMFVDDNTLTVNINRIRKKLEEIGIGDIIETKRGQGYILK